MKNIISNPLSLIGTIFSLIGTVIIVSDTFESGQNWYNRFDKFENIDTGLTNLNNTDTTLWTVTPTGIIGINDTGFSEIVKIIGNHRKTIDAKDISQIGLLTLEEFGEVKEKVLSIEMYNNGTFISITSEYIFLEWLNIYRERQILLFGLYFILVGFTLQLFSHFNYRYISNGVQKLIKKEY